MKISNDDVIQTAEEIGFDLIGFAPAEKLNTEMENLRDWLEKGYNSDMVYMERNQNKREDVSLILPSAKSVISLALNYYTNESYDNDIKDSGKVSRYAWGRDYHLIIWEMLDLLVKKMKKKFPEFEAAAYVDTGPVMDKAWAVKAGIGWLGKHSNVISRELGSWFFLATVITNAEFTYGLPSIDFCGSCTACISACPTNAIVENRAVDSNRCISYLTIENKVGIPKEFKGKFDNWIFGCDICQDVCPWNKKFSKITNERSFSSKGNKQISHAEISGMSNSEFKRKFKESPISRAKLKGLKRNLEFIGH